MSDRSLDPKDWEAFRASAHRLLDQSLGHLEQAREGRVWTPLPEEMKDAMQGAMPVDGLGLDLVRDRLAALLPYGVGNTHPRFFGWVHGAGNAGGVMADIVAGAMNANVGGRDHGAIYVERQVIDWCREMMGFPDTSSGLIVSGTSMATIVALKVARDRRLGFSTRKTGLGAPRLVAYTSVQAHACIAGALDLLGLGSDCLRLIPSDSDFRMDLAALRDQITADRRNGYVPFVVIGTAGAVNVGAIDDLDAIADIAANNDLWFHVDGAFGAAGMLSDHVRPLLNGLSRADSLAFDFHKWLHVNYDAGCVLIRDGDAHLRSFSDRPDYLAGSERGLAAGNPWPTDFGPELSRGFRALKIWAHFMEHGRDKLGASITLNCEQAQYLAAKVRACDVLELMAPVALNIVCFRYVGTNLRDIDKLNEEIVISLQESGVAVPSTTRINGNLAIRVNITNHRTRQQDLDILVDACVNAGKEIART